MVLYDFLANKLLLHAGERVIDRLCIRVLVKEFDALALFSVVRFDNELPGGWLSQFGGDNVDCLLSRNQPSIFRIIACPHITDNGFRVLCLGKNEIQKVLVSNERNRDVVPITIEVIVLKAESDIGGIECAGYA